MIYDFHLSFRIHDFSKARSLVRLLASSVTHAYSSGLSYCLFVADSALVGRAIPTPQPELEIAARKMFSLLN